MRTSLTAVSALTGAFAFSVLIVSPNAAVHVEANASASDARLSDASSHAARPQAAASSAAQDVTVDSSANPELVGAITKEMGVTPAQAQGGAGALLGLAKTRLKPAEFTKVESAVPGTDALLKAAPATKGMAGMGGMGGAMGLASLAGSFKQLGLPPEAALKMAPVLTKFVQSKGSSEAAALLSGVLK